MRSTPARTTSPGDQPPRDGPKTILGELARAVDAIEGSEPRRDAKLVAGLMAGPPLLRVVVEATVESRPKRSSIAWAIGARAPTCRYALISSSAANGIHGPTRTAAASTAAASSEPNDPAETESAAARLTAGSILGDATHRANGTQHRPIPTEPTPNGVCRGAQRRQDCIEGLCNPVECRAVRGSRYGANGTIIILAWHPIRPHRGSAPHVSPDLVRAPAWE